MGAVNMTLGAGFTSSGVNPGNATSNSMYEYYVVYADDPVAGSPRIPDSIMLLIDDGIAITYTGTQMQQFAGLSGNWRTGIRIPFRVSAGLDTFGATFGPNSLFDPTFYRYKLVRGCPWLTSYGDGTPLGHNWKIVATIKGTDDGNGNVSPDVVVTASGSGPTVHDSFRSLSNPTVNKYGGRVGDEDGVHSFPEGYPLALEVDPLNVTPYEVPFPDEGTSTSTYTFQTHYNNWDGLKPGPWVPYYSDSMETGNLFESGVMVYLRNLDRPTDPYWGIFRGHHMYKTDPAGADGDANYILSIVPPGSNIVKTGTKAHWNTTWGWNWSSNHAYESLPPGRYEYYFACSDDDFSAFGADKQTVWPYLDASPALPTPVAPNDRLFGTGAPSSRLHGINYTLSGISGYVDKRTYMPGGWVNGYPYDSWQGSSLSPTQTNINAGVIKYPMYTYPEVDPGLYQVGGSGISGAPGGSRFMGTLSPFKRSVNPAIPYQDSTGSLRLWSETAGASDKDTLTFQINYWQSQGVAPSYVRLFINNSWRAEDGGWKSYDMQRISPANPTVADYKAGVLYAVNIDGNTMGYGPHCYYIEAADQSWTDYRYTALTGISIPVGSRVVRFPRRPDTVMYDGNTYYDGVLPSASPDPNVDVGIPQENDIINGPYINTRPVLVDKSWSVTPSVGTSGTEFLYKVTYQDADNQRPYTANLIIETDDAGTIFTANMVRAPESDVPGNSTKTFMEGVVYEFKASSAPGLRLQPGNRRYRFSFTDDWGRQTNVDDRISGETVTAPQYGSGWIGGPVMTGNTAPKLSSGSVRSADGTANEATTWNYKVTYTDADNNPPSYMLVYIGRQDTPGGPIVWDSGNAMVASNPADSVYSDGKDYQFSTRLPGDNTTPIKYYSCFASSDGIDPADYSSTLSPSSGMVWKTAESPTVVASDTRKYTLNHKPIVTDIPPTSKYMTPTNYADPLIYISGALKTKGTDYTIDNANGIITFTAAPSAGTVTAKYWFGTAPDPNTGPSAVTGNHAPELADGKVLPLYGTSSSVFTYSVTYKDLDGQAPQFINAVIDDVRHPMVNVTGSTTYKNGVVYQCSTTLTTGTHQFYFETSDGGSLILFDNDNSNTIVDPIQGPYINDHPTFSGALINPNGTVDQGQPITYTVTYSDKDNDAPMIDYPVVYVDNPNEVDWTGSVTAYAENKIVDNTQAWTDHQFDGMPVEVSVLDQSGNTNKIVYKIDHNTKNELYLVATDVADTVTVGSPYTIGKLSMIKQDQSDQIYADGVVYEAKAPFLGVGIHKAHFKAVVSEQIQPGVFSQYTLIAPSSGDLTGPTVQALAPATNVGPTLTNGGVAPRTGTASTPFRFAVTYTDVNGDTPFQSHQGVTGDANVWIEETPGNWVKHPLATDQDAPNVSVGVEYSFAMSGLSLGPHNYYFDASDGWVSARFPAAGYQTVYVSRPPVLLEGSVTPVSGNKGRVYEYKVKYRDPDNDPPAYIKLVIDGGTPVDIGVPMPGSDYITGVVYSYPSLAGALDERLHNYYFMASDGNGFAWYDQDVKDQEAASNPDPHKNGTSDVPPSPVRAIDGPSVHSNNAPVLLNGAVNVNGVVGQTSGFDLDTFNYSVTYKDPDGDDPEYVECYIDDPTTDMANPTASHAFKMTKNPNQNDFVQGVSYTLAKTGLAAGTHKFFFRAKDWMAIAYYPANPTGNQISGPTVSTRAAGTLSLSVPTSVAIGDSVTITGTLTGASSAPIANALISIKLVKPDGTQVTPQPVVTTNASGQFTYPEGTATWKPPVTGTWKISASWPGNTQCLLTNSAEKSLNVQGPSMTVNGLDMISVPLQPISSFPDGVFGRTPAFALAKWLPSKVDYKLYSLIAGIRTDYDFPGVTPGQAYWIKTQTAKTLAPTGTLVDPYTDYQISLGVGWNQLGSPFTSEVTWSSLKVRRTVSGVVQELSIQAAGDAGWVNSYGWTYDTASNNYKLVDATKSGADRTLRPWRGYWIKANMYCTLVIPAPGRAAKSDAAPKLLSLGSEGTQAVSSAKWQIRLTAKNGNLKDEYNFIGAGRSGDEKMESPACFQNYVDLYLSDSKGGMFASYLKGNVDVGQEWTLNVVTDKAGEVVLAWDGLDNLPSGIKLVLVSEDGKTTDIITGGSYKFTAGEGGATKSFRVLVEKS